MGESKLRGEGGGGVGLIFMYSTPQLLLELEHYKHIHFVASAAADDDGDDDDGADKLQK